jgi:hypothetical protein
MDLMVLGLLECCASSKVVFCLGKGRLFSLKNACNTFTLMNAVDGKSVVILLIFLFLLLELMRDCFLMNESLEENERC